MLFIVIYLSEIKKKYLLFLSPLSYQRHLLRIMHPFVLVEIVLSSFSFTVIKGRK